MKKADSFLKFQKGIILILFTLGTFCISYSQNYGYEYTYDAAGNRNKRMYIKFKSGAPANEVQNSYDTASITDIGLNHEFIIHPNPTMGIIQIYIYGDNNVNMKFSLYTLGGSLVRKFQQTGTTVTIDLSNQPNGMYILVCQFDDQRKEWKIIKE